LKVRDKILKYLINNADANGICRLHTKAVERDLIEEGRGSVSTSRYLRKMRQEGLIDYDDPRHHIHYYEIRINKDKVMSSYKGKDKTIRLYYIDVRCKNCGREISGMVTRNEILYIKNKKAICTYCYKNEFEIRKHRGENPYTKITI